MKANAEDMPRFAPLTPEVRKAVLQLLRRGVVENPVDRYWAEEWSTGKDVSEAQEEWLFKLVQRDGRRFSKNDIVEALP